MLRTTPPWKALILTLLLAALAAAPAAASGPAKAKPSPDEIMLRLKNGNQRFTTGQSAHPNSGMDRVALVGKEDQGDHVIATIVGCSDSRVPLEIIFDVGVADIFVVRVAGNVINTDEAGSIEYGLAHVHTPLLVILGHTKCGAVAAATRAVEGHGHPLERNIPPLVAPILPAVRQAMRDHPEAHGPDLAPYAIEANVWQGVRNLFFMSPATRDLVKSGRVKVAGAIYDVGAGTVSWLPEDRVARILAEVEADPKRAMEPMADEKKQAPARKRKK